MGLEKVISSISKGRGLLLKAYILHLSEWSTLVFSINVGLLTRPDFPTKDVMPMP